MTTESGTTELAALADRVGELLRSSRSTAAVAESLTGGLIVSALARVEGAGEWLQGGIVVYASEVKHDLLEVRPGPVVSRGAAHDLAVNVARLLDADFGLSITGVGGPEPQDGVEPGTVWMAVARSGEACTPVCVDLDGGPSEVCHDAAALALRLLAEALDSSVQG